jgi:pimeloyl-ACP methyl ester carboxylesterase
VLHVENAGAEDGPIVVLLHGLGVNGAAWDGVRDALPAHLCLVIPDFAGHGLSPRAANYSLGRHAADVAELLPPGAKVTVVGHSMGGAVGLIMATGWFGVTVERVVTIGMKMNWTAEEAAKMGRPYPVRWFDTREAAAERFLLVTGQAKAATPSARVVERGIVEESGRWSLACDPETVRVVGPETADLIAGARAGGAALQLVCGDEDPLVTLDEMRQFDPNARSFPGGHNLHLENPLVIKDLLSS